jgi:hypothetical protein
MVQPVKHIPSTLLQKQSPPRTYAQLNESMDAMDKSNSTSFKDWILSEENIGYVCTFKRHLWEENWETNPCSVIIVMQFLHSKGGWSSPSMAEMMLKMFLHWGVDSPRFGALLNGIVRGITLPEEEEDKPDESWEKRQIYDLVYIILIDNSAKEAAKFLRHLTTKYTLTKGFNGTSDPLENDAPETKQWSRKQIIDLFKGVSYRRQWTESFRRELLVEFVQLVISDKQKQEHFEYDIRVKCMGSLENSASSSSSVMIGKSFQESVNSSIELLDTILLEAECEELVGSLRESSILSSALRRSGNSLDKFMAQLTKSDSKVEFSTDDE